MLAVVSGWAEYAELPWAFGPGRSPRMGRPADRLSPVCLIRFVLNDRRMIVPTDHLWTITAMDEEIAKATTAEANEGIEKVLAGRADEASVHFTNALDRVGQIVNDRVRRDELSLLAGAFDHCGFPDLALMAAQQAIDLDKTLGLDALLASDMLALGNAHASMENTTKAEAAFRQALAVFIDQNNFGDAASATTNIAAIVANRGEMDDAIELLEKSLGYLEQSPFDETEIQTRFALLQALEITKRDAKAALQNARELCSERLMGKIPPPQVGPTKQFVADVIARYLKEYPVADKKKWKAANFPTLAG